MCVRVSIVFGLGGALDILQTSSPTVSLPLCNIVEVGPGFILNIFGMKDSESQSSLFCGKAAISSPWNALSVMAHSLTEFRFPFKHCLLSPPNLK